jgi:hypothetical protein
MARIGLFALALLAPLVCLGPSYPLYAQAESHAAATIVASPVSQQALTAPALPWFPKAKVSSVPKLLPPAQPATWHCNPPCIEACWDGGDNLICCEDACCRVTCFQQ